MNKGFADADQTSDASLRFMRKLEQHGHAKATMPQQIEKEVERVLARVSKLNDPEMTLEVNHELIGIEGVAQQGGDTQLLDRVKAARAKLCTKKGAGRLERSKCEKLMWEVCGGPGSTPNSELVPMAECHSFFLGKAVAGAPAAAAPAGAPAGPAASILGGKREGKLPDQGYGEVSEKFVEHNNQVTMTSDWRREFGPSAGHRSFLAICKDHPGNEWCLLHGYYKQKFEIDWHSASAVVAPSGVTVIASLLVTALAARG